MNVVKYCINIFIIFKRNRRNFYGAGSGVSPHFIYFFATLIIIIIIYTKEGGIYKVLIS